MPGMGSGKTGLGATSRRSTASASRASSGSDAARSRDSDRLISSQASQMMLTNTHAAELESRGATMMPIVVPANHRHFSTENSARSVSE